MVFKQDVLAVVLQQLVDIKPLPSLIMRTVIQTLRNFPVLVPFIISILQRLILKQIWNDDVLFEGLVKCCKMTAPHSFPVMVSLPPTELDRALKQIPEMRKLLAEYCKSNVQAIPRAILQVINPE